MPIEVADATAPSPPQDTIAPPINQPIPETPPIEPEEPATLSSKEAPKVEYWDANVLVDGKQGMWRESGMTLKDTKQDIGGKDVNIPGVLTANETTDYLYRVDGKILDKPANIPGYDSPYPQNLPEDFVPPKKEEKVEETNKDKTSILKVGIHTDNPQEIILSDDIKALRDSKDEFDQKLYRILVNDGIDDFNRAIDAANFVSQQEYNRQSTALAQLDKFKDKDGYSLGQALAAGIKPETIEAAGFTKADVDASRKEAAYIKASPEEKFALLKKDGLIPSDAKFDKMNSDGTISYTVGQVTFADVSPKAPDLPNASLKL